MTKRMLKGLIILLCILLFPVKGISFDSDNVHPTINETSIRLSINLVSALQNLGFNNVR